MSNKSADILFSVLGFGLINLNVQNHFCRFSTRPHAEVLMVLLLAGSGSAASILKQHGGLDIYSWVAMTTQLTPQVT